mgnify:CR=1 FL=1
MTINNYLEVICLEARATSGAPIGRCIREALQIAVSEWRNVEFVHNLTRFRIDVNDLFACAREARMPEERDASGS